MDKIEGEPENALVSAPFDKFCNGVRQMRGYSLTEKDDGLELFFEPWSTELSYPIGGPCIRILLRRYDDRIVLEEFTVDDADGPRSVSISAARDALQAWMDSVAD